MAAQLSPETSTGIVIVFHAFAIVSTIFRLGHRTVTHRFWWDDAWAALALIFDILTIVPIIVLTYGKDESPTALIRVVVYWIELIGFNGTLWSTRMSLIVAIVRITPPTLKIRRFAVATAFAFTLMWIGIATLSIWICASNPSWHRSTWSFCYLGTTENSIQLSADFISVFLLVAIPFRLLWRSKMPRDQHKLILLLFSSSTLTMVVSVAHAVLIFNETSGGLSEAIASHVEVSVSLVICNLLIIVTYLYRIFHDGEDMESTVDYSGIVCEAMIRAEQLEQQAHPP